MSARADHLTSHTDHALGRLGSCVMAFAAGAPSGDPVTDAMVVRDGSASTDAQLMQVKTRAAKAP